MDILHLRYFSHVYGTLNYSHSAESLFISRQALRQAIQNVERELGQPLFISVSNRLRATPLAKRLYEASRESLFAFEKLQESIAEIKAEPKKASINFCCMTDAQEVYTDVELKHFHQQNTMTHASDGAEIHYSTGSCEQIRQGILNGLLDCGLLFTSQDWEDERFDRWCVAPYEQRRLYLLVNSLNPLAKKASVRIADVKGVPFATQGESYDIHRLLESRCKAQGFEPEIAFTSNSYPNIVNQVASNFAASYAFRDMMYHHHWDNLVCVPFREPSMSWSACLITKKGLLVGSVVEKSFCWADVSARLFGPG
jgi:LysR family transcriptional activator of glutamate synthase operon